MQRARPRRVAVRSLSPAELLERCLHPDDDGVLNLDAVVRFRRRTRQHPVSFVDFLQALRRSGNGDDNAKNPITTVFCYPSMALGIRQDEWDQIVQTFGQMPYLKRLAFLSGYGGFNAITANALAQTLERSSSIRTLELSEGVVIVGSLEELQRLAMAVAASPLKTYTCDCLFRFQGQPNPRHVMVEQGISLCTTLESLSLRDFMHQLSADEITQLIANLTHLKQLCLYTSHWQSLGQALTNNNTLEVLQIADHDVEPEAFCACMDSLQANRKIRRLTLHLRLGFKNDGMKESVASLLEHNVTLENVVLCDTIDGIFPPPSRCFTHFDFASLSHGMAVNGLVQVDVDGLASHVHDDDRESLCRYRQQLEVENKLNEIGRRDLRKNLGDRFKWLEAMLKLTMGDAPAFERDSFFLADEGLYRTQCFFGFFLMNSSLFDGL